jgi:hypothetical protein
MLERIVVMNELMKKGSTQVDLRCVAFGQCATRITSSRNIDLIACDRLATTVESEIISTKNLNLTKIVKV